MSDYQRIHDVEAETAEQSISRLLVDLAETAVATAEEGVVVVEARGVEVRLDERFSRVISYWGLPEVGPSESALDQIRDVNEAEGSGIGSLRGEDPEIREQEPDDLVSRLERIADLRRTGALSEEEFAHAKRRLLK